MTEITAQSIDERSILESLCDGISVIDCNWRYTYLNQRQAQWLEKSKEDVLGKAIWEICPDWTALGIQQQIQRSSIEQTSVQIEYFCPKRRGWFELRVSPSTKGITILTIEITQRKQKETALQDSQFRFEAFMNHSPASAWIANETGYLLYLSPFYLETFSVNQDAVGKHISEIFPPETAQQFLENNQHVFETGQALQTVEYAPSSEGNVRSFLVCKFPIHEPGKTLLGGFAVDITEQERTETALRESEQQLRIALRTAKLGSWQHDLITDVLTCSDQCKANFGLPADAEFTHETLFAALHPEDRDRVQAAIQRAIEERTDYEVEERCFYPDGSLHWLIARGGLIYDADGNPIRLVGVTLDITERKQFEESLKSANQRVSNILESITDAFVAFDRDWHYTYVNQEAGKLLGYAPEALLGRRWQDIFPDLAQKGTLFSKQFEQVMNDRVTVHFEGFSHATNRWLETSVFPAPDGISVFFRDISDRKQEEQRKALQYAISQILADAATFVDAAPAILQALCETLGWQMGVIWSLDEADSVLRYVNRWSEPMVNAQPFIKASQHDTFDYEIGLPGRIWKARQPIWIADLTQDQNFPRGAEASEAGLRAGFGFPILLGDEFFGVIECFSDRPQEPDEDLIRLMTAIGRQTGQFIERKRTETALRESQALFQSFITHSPIAAFIKDESGRYVYVNSLIEQLFERPASELIGHSDSDWFPVESIAQIRSNDAAVLTDNEALQFLESVRFGEEDRHFIAFKFPLEDTLGRRFLGGVSIEITDRVQAEAALRQREEELRVITNTVPVLISFVDADQRYRFISQRYEDWFGRSPEEIQGKYIWEVLGEAAYNVVRPYIEQALSGQAVNFEQEMPYHGARLRYISASYVPQRSEQGQVTGFVAMVSDISDRKQHEEALRASAERLSLALTAAKMGDWSWDAATDIVTFSQQACEIFGMKCCSNLTWTQLQQRLQAEDQEKARTAVNRAISERIDYDIEYRVTADDQTQRWIAAKGRAQYDATENVLGMHGVVQDVTERKQAEAEREQLLQREKAAREQAETANRLKDEFLAVLSHELRSPLNPILGWTKLLRSRNFDLQERDRALEIIERNAKLQTQLIDDLLDVSRILRGKLALNIQPINLAIVVESALETVRLAAGAKEITIQKHFPKNAIYVSGDAGRLQQVVWNLLTNAVKFTPKHGQVEVTLSQDENEAIVHVKDNGKGITLTFLPHVFDYFRQEDSTTTRKFGGLGLGLAIVRHLTELHGGTVEVESAGENLGATFTVRLPLLNYQPEHSNSDNTEEATAPSAPLAGLHILAIDDEPDMRDLLEMILTEYGAETKVTASPQIVLSEIDRADIFISDIGMPQVDGYMLMRQIRSLASQQARTIPAIALTAYASEIDQQQALTVGFQKHLAKPIEPDQLIDAILQLVDLKADQLNNSNSA